MLSISYIKRAHTPPAQAIKPTAQREVSGVYCNYGNMVTAMPVLTDSATRVSFMGQHPLTNDSKYIDALAKGVGCDAEQLTAVIGPNELAARLKEAKLENFDPANAENGKFQINMHLHSDWSDGRFTPEVLFREAGKQAANIKENGYDRDFIVAITDHDTTEGVKATLEYIADKTKEDPNRFNGIKFVPGIEFFGKYYDSKFLKKPTAFELMGYCINPYDEKFENFLKTTHEDYNEAIDTVITEAGAKHGIDTSDFEEYRQNDKILKVPSGVAASVHLGKYLKEKGLTTGERKQLLRGKFMPKIPTVKTILESTQGSMVGISHPIRVNLKPFMKNPKDRESDVLYKLLTDFKTMGGYTAEGNYQLPEKFNDRITILPEKKTLAQKANSIREICDRAGLLKTGGIDNHGTTLLAYK